MVSVHPVLHGSSHHILPLYYHLLLVIVLIVELYHYVSHFLYM